MHSLRDFGLSGRGRYVSGIRPAYKVDFTRNNRFALMNFGRQILLPTTLQKLRQRIACGMAF